MTPGRNEPCPCGSGRKFKRCCGAAESETRQQSVLSAETPAIPRQIPTIVNNDGHLLVQTTSFYEVGDPDSVFIEIESWRPKPDLEKKRGHDRRLESFEAHFQRKPRARRTVGERVLVAHLTWRQGAPLVVETNSTERDLEIREKLSLLPPGDIRLLRSEGRSMFDLLSQPVSQDQLSVAREEKEFSRRPEVVAKLAEIMRDYSRRWCDEVIPALGNRRPRTLVKTEAGRAKVLSLIEQFERTPGPPGQGAMDCSLIRHELGLPPAG